MADNSNSISKEQARMEQNLFNIIRSFDPNSYIDATGRTPTASVIKSVREEAIKAYVLSISSRQENCSLYTSLEETREMTVLYQNFGFLLQSRGYRQRF